MNKTEVIKSEVEAILKKMVDEFEVEVVNEENVFQVIIKVGDEASVIIGRHGETIRAIQKILEVILYKKFAESTTILININDYREKQKERLENLAREFAEKALAQSGPIEAGNLSSYERKVIHEFISNNYPDLSSHSAGEGKDRRLVVDLKENGTAKEEN